MATKHIDKEISAKKTAEAKTSRARPRRNDPTNATYSDDPRWLEAQEEAREGDLGAEAGDDPWPD